MLVQFTIAGEYGAETAFSSGYTFAMVGDDVNNIPNYMFDQTDEAHGLSVGTVKSRDEIPTIMSALRRQTDVTLVPVKFYSPINQGGACRRAENLEGNGQFVDFSFTEERDDAKRAELMRMLEDVFTTRHDSGRYIDGKFTPTE